MESKKVLFVADLGLEANIFAGVVGGGSFIFQMPTKPYFFFGGVQSFKWGGWHVHMFVRILSHWSYQIYAQHIDYVEKTLKRKAYSWTILSIPIIFFGGSSF